jgi:hypothetical protein
MMAAQLQGDKFERGKFTLYFNSAVDDCLILVFCGLKILVRNTDHILGTGFCETQVVHCMI